MPGCSIIIRIDCRCPLNSTCILIAREDQSSRRSCNSSSRSDQKYLLGFILGIYKLRCWPCGSVVRWFCNIKKIRWKLEVRCISTEQVCIYCSVCTLNVKMIIDRIVSVYNFTGTVILDLITGLRCRIGFFFQMIIITCSSTCCWTGKTIYTGCTECKKQISICIITCTSCLRRISCCICNCQTCRQQITCEVDCISVSKQCRINKCCWITIKPVSVISQIISYRIRPGCSIICGSWYCRIQSCSVSANIPSDVCCCN